mmetsp:Transcript_12881/g.31595  ORF Transcript_12881/g.31595 Transcript_12881/m.31595 type:complete len:364 (+) Transcript_12881:395-1486(+)
MVMHAHVFVRHDKGLPLLQHRESDISVCNPLPVPQSPHCIEPVRAARVVHTQHAVALAHTGRPDPLRPLPRLRRVPSGLRALGRQVHEASRRLHHGPEQPLAEARHEARRTPLRVPSHGLREDAREPLGELVGKVLAVPVHVAGVLEAGCLRVLPLLDVLLVARQLHEALGHGPRDLARGVEHAVDRVAPQRQRPFGHALGELRGRLGDALRRLVEEIVHARAQVVDEADGVAEEFEGADEGVELVDELVLVVLAHAGEELVLRRKGPLEDQRVELDRGLVDVGHDHAQRLHGGKHGVVRQAAALGRRAGHDGARAKEGERDEDGVQLEQLHVELVALDGLLGEEAQLLEAAVADVLRLLLGR